MFITKKCIKKIYHPSISFFFRVSYNINMPNTQQNNIQNEIERINKGITLQDRLKKNEKSQNQFQNGLKQIGRIRVKKGQRTDLSQTKDIQNIVKNISK